MCWMGIEVGNWLIIIWLLWCLHFVFVRIWTVTSSLSLCTLKLVGHVSHFSFVCLFDCWIWVTEMGWLGIGTVLMLPRPCKACLCGNSVSKHNLEWTFNGGSVSKIYLCEDCWQPNNCLCYVKDLLCGNQVGRKLLLSFFLCSLGLQYWFFWEVPHIFEQWPCYGEGWFIHWGMRIATV